jgi:hypothetical protein
MSLRDVEEGTVDYLKRSGATSMSGQELPKRVAGLLKRAKPEAVRFIKLGRKSAWWPISRDTNTIRLGFRQFDFKSCISGNWEQAKTLFIKTTSRSRPADVTRAVNQVREFFELPEATLWVTIEDGDVWWCFAEPEVRNIYTGDNAVEEKQGARTRKVIDRWRNTDVQGKRLRLDGMTTKITKVASFQETICKPHGAADLLRKIRCEESKQYTRAAKAYDDLILSVGDLLDQLHLKDFELLIELVFSSSGWKRISAVGGTQKTLDLALTLPTTGESCFVQVKSQTDKATFEKLVEELDNYSGYTRMFFVYHTPSSRFENSDVDRVTVWSRYEVAKQVIGAGLVNWTLARTT